MEESISTPSESESPSTYKPVPTFTNPIQYDSKTKTLAGNRSSAASVQRLLQASERRQRDKRAANPTRSYNDVEELQKHNMAVDLSRQITRRWRPGDVYAPHDLSEVEMAKWKRREKPNYDVFDVLDLNPLDHYRVCAPLSCSESPSLQLYVSRS
jgi:small subunit ribosomal protein S18